MRQSHSSVSQKDTGNRAGTTIDFTVIKAESNDDSREEDCRKTE